MSKNNITIYQEKGELRSDLILIYSECLCDSINHYL